MRPGRSSLLRLPTAFLGLLAALALAVAALFGGTGAAWAAPCSVPGCEGGSAMTGSVPGGAAAGVAGVSGIAGGAGSLRGTPGVGPVPGTCIQQAACGGGAASGPGGGVGLGLLAALGMASGACGYLTALRLRRRPTAASALARGVTALVLRPPRFA